MTRAAAHPLIALLLAGAAVSAVAQPAESLPDLEVHGQRAPLDSTRPRLARLVPCLGCEAQRQAVDNLALDVLRFVLLPSEPPDLRDVTPVSLAGTGRRTETLP